jgi:hypothetical protein
MIEGTCGAYITRTGQVIQEGQLAYFAPSVDARPQPVKVEAIIFSNPEHVTVTIKALWGYETLTGPQANRLMSP